MMNRRSSTLTLCGRMIIASTNFQRRTGHSGVTFATLAVCLGVIVSLLLKKIEWEKAKRADFVSFATTALSSHSASANNEITRTSHSVSVWCTYKYSLYHPQPSLLLLLYELKFTPARYFKPNIKNIFLRNKMKSPCPRTIKTVND